MYPPFKCLLEFEYQKMMTVDNRVISDKFLPILLQPNITNTRFGPTNFPFNAIRNLEKHWVWQTSTIFLSELLWNHKLSYEKHWVWQTRTIFPNELLWNHKLSYSKNSIRIILKKWILEGRGWTPSRLEVMVDVT